MMLFLLKDCVCTILTSIWPPLTYDALGKMTQVYYYLVTIYFFVQNINFIFNLIRPHDTPECTYCLLLFISTSIKNYLLSFVSFLYLFFLLLPGISNIFFFHHHHWKFFVDDYEKKEDVYDYFVCTIFVFLLSSHWIKMFKFNEKKDNKLISLLFLWSSCVDAMNESSSYFWDICVANKSLTTRWTRQLFVNNTFNYLFFFSGFRFVFISLYLSIVWQLKVWVE